MSQLSSDSSSLSSPPISSPSSPSSSSSSFEFNFNSINNSNNNSNHNSNNNSNNSSPSSNNSSSNFSFDIPVPVNNSIACLSNNSTNHFNHHINNNHKNNNFNSIPNNNNSNCSSPSSSNNSSLDSPSDISIPINNPFDYENNHDKFITRKLPIPKIRTDETNYKYLIFFIPHKYNIANSTSHDLKSQLMRYFRSTAAKYNLSPSIDNDKIIATLIKPARFPIHYKIKIAFPKELFYVYHSFTHFIDKYHIKFEYDYVQFHTFILGPIALHSSESQLVSEFKQHIDPHADIAFIYNHYHIFGHSAISILPQASINNLHKYNYQTDKKWHIRLQLPNPNMACTNCWIPNKHTKFQCKVASRCGLCYGPHHDHCSQKVTQNCSLCNKGMHPAFACRKFMKPLLKECFPPKSLITEIQNMNNNHDEAEMKSDYLMDPSPPTSLSPPPSVLSNSHSPPIITNSPPEHSTSSYKQTKENNNNWSQVIRGSRRSNRPSTVTNSKASYAAAAQSRNNSRYLVPITPKSTQINPSSSSLKSNSSKSSLPSSSQYSDSIMEMLRSLVETNKRSEENSNRMEQRLIALEATNSNLVNDLKLLQSENKKLKLQLEEATKSKNINSSHSNMNNKANKKKRNQSRTPSPVRISPLPLIVDAIGASNSGNSSNLNLIHSPGIDNSIIAT